MNLKSDHITFFKTKNRLQSGIDCFIKGSGYLQSDQKGEIILDLSSNNNGAIQPVLQDRIKLNKSGLFNVSIKFIYDEEYIDITLCVNNSIKNIRGVLKSKNFIANVILLNQNGNVLYEYKLKSNQKKYKSSNLNKKTIRLYAPTILNKDAIGNYCIWLYKFFTKSGFSVKMYADGFNILDNPEISKACDLFYDLQPSDKLFVIYSVYDPWLEYIIKLKNFKILSFQNVTPAFFFSKWDMSSENLCNMALSQFQKLEKFDAFLSSTNFTAEYLNSFFKNKKKFNIVPPFGVKKLSPPQKRMNRIEGVNILFVGRVVPNKRIEDILKVFSEVVRLEPNAKLNIVGSLGLKNYVNYIKLMVDELNIDKEKVFFAGSVSDEELEKYYLTSDVFICMSQHEGFCVPVYEAMQRNVLVCALNQGAVNEVLGGSGLIYDINTPSLYADIAKSIIKYLKDEELYAAAVKKQFSRSLQLSKNADGKKILNILCKENEKNN